MEAESYLQWLVQETPTHWWHDSADPSELTAGLANRASGVTTNPVLTAQALRSQPDYWHSRIMKAWEGQKGEEKVEMLMRVVAEETASRLEEQYIASQKSEGYVCAQVNPARAGDREAMLAMAVRFHSWARNIAVKLPVTAAGLDVLEECVAQGITVTATVSFTVSQVIAVAERHSRGSQRARSNSVRPGNCFAVIMIGRLDDYLRDLANDQRAGICEEDIRQAGLSVVKNAYAIFQQEGYAAVLLVAALRGEYHMTRLAGGKLIMSIHPVYQRQLLESGIPRQVNIHQPIEKNVIQRLSKLPDFQRAHDPEGMTPEQFLSYGLTQRTLAQFQDAGWAFLEGYALARKD
jgi:transaldolase